MIKKLKQIMLSNDTLKLLNKAKGLLYLNEENTHHISDETVIKQSLNHLVNTLNKAKKSELKL